MKPNHKNYIVIAVAATLLTAGVAAAASYITKENIRSEQAVATPVKKPVAARTATHTNASAAPQSAAPRCNDNNVLGYVAGGAAGGILGSQVGKGNGNTAATIGGTLGGAYLGGQYIPLHNATCRL